MGKKMKFPFLFKPTETTAAWPCPACANNPRTLSFRVVSTDNTNKTMIKTAFSDNKNSPTASAENPDLFFSEVPENDDEDSAVILRGLRAERLFYKPGKTNSILEESKLHDFPRKRDVEIVSLESNDPLVDFRASMEVMVEEYGLREWGQMQKLVSYYLKVNEKNNYGYIMEAFVGLLTDRVLSDDYAIDELQCSSSTTANTQCSLTSPPSTFSSSVGSSASPCLSNGDDKVTEKTDAGCTTSSSCNA